MAFRSSHQYSITPGGGGGRGGLTTYCTDVKEEKAGRVQYKRCFTREIVNVFEEFFGKLSTSQNIKPVPA